MTDSKTLDAALDYAQQGYAIFPLKPDSKVPLTTHGHKDATTDEAQIREWWTREPKANIGLLIGEAANVLVFDVESVEGHGVDGFLTLTGLEEDHGSLRETYAVKSATGGGHFYYNYPDELKGKLTKKDLGEGVELKYKGYVVAPPSAVNGSAYEVIRSSIGERAEVLPEWMKLLIKEQPSREDWERMRPKGSGPSICEQNGIRMSDVLTLPSDARKVGDGYLIKSPIHGATGGGNMFVNPALNLWCCYRHDTGGDPLTYVAMREGFVSCEDAGPLDVETALKCKDVLRSEGLIQESQEIKEPEHVENDVREPSVDHAARSAWYDGEMSSVTIYVNGKPILKQLPEIVPVVVVDGPKTIEDLLTVFHEHLYFEEDYNVTGPVCAFLGNFTPQDPCIIGIVGPSGSIKTEMIRSFGEAQNQFCYPISSITENTLISGMDKNIDTIPLLRGRVLTIKDLTTLLSKNDDIRSAIFADFREVNDGFIHKEFGNGVKKEYHDIHSTILFASTPAIERYYSMYANLGTRMLFMRPQNDPIKARKKSRENQIAGIKPIRKTLQDAILSFVDVSVERLMSEPLPEIPGEIEEEIGRYCDVLAWLRHPLHHDLKGYVDEIAPDPEFPTRLMNAICLLTQMHAFIYKRATVDREHDLEFARRIIADNVPINRAAILTYLTDEWQSTSVLSQDSGINPQSLYRPLDELTVLGLAKKVSREDAPMKGLDGRSSHYRLTPAWSQSIQSLYSVISLGGRVREKIKGNPQGEDTVRPDGTIQKSGDQAELVCVVRDVMTAWRDANGTKKVNRTHFVNEVAAVIRARHPQWAGRSIEDDINRLGESDSEIQALLAELTMEDRLKTKSKS